MTDDLYIDLVSKTIISKLSKEIAAQITIEMSTVISSEIKNNLDPILKKLDDYDKTIMRVSEEFSSLKSFVRLELDKLTANIKTHLSIASIPEKQINDIRAEISELHRAMLNVDKLVLLENSLELVRQDINKSKDLSLLSNTIKETMVSEVQGLKVSLKAIETIISSVDFEKTDMRRAASMILSTAEEIKALITTSAVDKFEFENRQFLLIQKLISFVEETLPEWVAQKIKVEFSIIAEKLAELNNANRSIMNIFEHIR